ncbi:MAG TPA: methionine--tRNA ligase [Planctomycetota bacterium]|nr:methionine--tRNA ligase [Planctomycetota bacterium]
MKKVLVTSALPYANGRVHLGHLAGAYLPADIYVRWLRLKGNDVRFICGSDEHGVPITLTALKRKCSPQDVVDEFHKANGEAFAAANVKFDIWGRTSSPEHHTLTQQFFTRLYSKGYIEKRQTQQLYSEKSKMFLPDRYVEGTCPVCGDENARGDQCDKCGSTYEVTELKNPRVAIEGDGSTPVLKSTSHWFLKLDAFSDRLKEFVASHSEGSTSPWRLNAQREATGWLKRGLQARAITRDTEWGVKIPLDDPDAAGKRLYVWFDAPIGYVTFTQQLFAKEGNPEGWKDFWQNPDCAVVNFIGKDNIPFHAITWPAMQIGANDAVPAGERPYQLVSQVVANEFLNFGADKFSKSRGNIIEIGWFVEKYGSESLRYYLTAVAPENNDSTFTWEDFLLRYNGELADILGNYIHRVLTFAVNKLGGKIPEPGELGNHKAFMEETATALSTSGALLDGLQFRNALAAVINCARAGNVYFDANAPWKSLKTDVAECNRLMYVCLSRAAALGLMLRPFLPQSSAAILKNFGLEDAFKPGSATLRPEDIARPGVTLGKPEVLFKKLEPKDLPGGEAKA